ncbi:MAG: FkbM family methyltransferase [Elusimicrobiota bacterium]
MKLNPKNLLSSENKFILVDIGSMGGIEKEWLNLGNNLKTVGFEPDNREYSKLKTQENQIFFNSALSHTDHEPLKIHLCRETGKSSILLPNQPFIDQYPFPQRYNVIETFQLNAEKVRTLDSILNENNILDVDFIKLDTQGSELDILKGSREKLKSIIGVKIEVEFHALYKNQPLFSDVDQFLRTEGFELYDLRRVYWKKTVNTTFHGKGQLIFGDALYFKSLDSFSKHIEMLSPAEKNKKIKRFIVACCTYGAYDFAADLMKSGQKFNAEFSNDYRKYLEEILNSGIWHKICSGFKSIRAARVLERLERILGKSYKNFADSDNYLGNRRIL